MLPSVLHSSDCPALFFDNDAEDGADQREFCRRCTQMHADEFRANALSERIIGCAFRVLNTLGAGFLEKVYENALAHEMREAGLLVAQQEGIKVYTSSR